MNDTPKFPRPPKLTESGKRGLSKSKPTFPFPPKSVRSAISASAEPIGTQPHEATEAKHVTADEATSSIAYGFEGDVSPRSPSRAMPVLSDGEGSATAVASYRGKELDANKFAVPIDVESVGDDIYEADDDEQVIEGGGALVSVETDEEEGNWMASDVREVAADVVSDEELGHRRADSVEDVAVDVEIDEDHEVRRPDVADVAASSEKSYIHADENKHADEFETSLYPGGANYGQDEAKPLQPEIQAGLGEVPAEDDEVQYIQENLHHAEEGNQISSYRSSIDDSVHEATWLGLAEAPRDVLDAVASESIEMPGRTAWIGFERHYPSRLQSPLSTPNDIYEKPAQKAKQLLMREVERKCKQTDPPAADVTNEAEVTTKGVWERIREYPWYSNQTSAGMVPPPTASCHVDIPLDPDRSIICGCIEAETDKDPLDFRWGMTADDNRWNYTCCERRYEQPIPLIQAKSVKISDTQLGIDGPVYRSVYTRRADYKMGNTYFRHYQLPTVSSLLRARMPEFLRKRPIRILVEPNAPGVMDLNGHIEFEVTIHPNGEASPDFPPCVHEHAHPLQLEHTQGHEHLRSWSCLRQHLDECQPHSIDVHVHRGLNMPQGVSGYCHHCSMCDKRRYMPKGPCGMPTIQAHGRFECIHPRKMNYRPPSCGLPQESHDIIRSPVPPCPICPTQHP